MKSKKASLFYARIVDLGSQLDRLEKKMTGKLLRLEPEYRNARSAMMRLSSAIRVFVDQEQTPVAEVKKKIQSPHIPVVMELFRKHGRQGVSPGRVKVVLGMGKARTVTHIILRAIELLAREGITVVHEGGRADSIYRVADDQD
jgi:hypothetical protein